MIIDLQSAGTVVRTVRMMSVLADLPGEISVNQLAEQVNLSTSTVHRLLQLLCDEGIAEWNPVTRGYSAGPGLYRLGARVVSSTPLAAIVEPFVRDLAHTYDETVLFGLYLPTEGAMAFVHRADGHQALQYRIDMHQPLSLVWGASGKAILAHLDDAEIEKIQSAANTSPAGDAPVPPLSEFREQLAEIRRTGVAVSDSEKLAGARGIASPVFGPRGIVGCLILTSPIDRMPHSGLVDIADAIRRSAAEASRLLGHPGSRKERT